MNCDLNKFSTYALGQIVEDDAEGKVLVQLVDPPRTCPDRSFSTHKGKLVVRADAQPTLSWSNTENRPIITVPRRDLIQHVQHPGHGFGFWLLIILLFGAGIAAAAWLYNWFTDREHRAWRAQLERETARRDDQRRRHAEAIEALKRDTDRYERQESYARELRGPSNRRKRQRARQKQKRLTNQERELLSPAPETSYQSRYAGPPAPPPQQVVHHHEVGNGFVNGMLMNEMLHSDHHHDRERIVEREVSRPQVQHEPDPPYTAPVPRREASEPTYTSSSDSSSSDGWGSIFSSDSDDSFSDDTSFSSDSDSTFGDD